MCLTDNRTGWGCVPIWAGMAILMVASAPAAVIIDPFDPTEQSVGVSDSPAGFKQAQSIVAAPEALGGERDITVQRISANSGSVDVDVHLSGPSQLAYSSGPNTDGRGIILWDGPGSAGLGGLNVSQSGANVGIFLFAASDLGATLTLDIGSSGGASAGSVLVPADPSFNFTPVFLPFTSFATTSGSGANFASINYVRLTINGPLGTDVLVDLITANSPEPLTLSLLGAGLLAIAGLARRKRTA